MSKLIVPLVPVIAAEESETPISTAEVTVQLEDRTITIHAEGQPPLVIGASSTAFAAIAAANGIRGMSQNVTGAGVTLTLGDMFSNTVLTQIGAFMSAQAATEVYVPFSIRFVTTTEAPGEPVSAVISLELVEGSGTSIPIVTGLIAGTDNLIATGDFAYTAHLTLVDDTLTLANPIYLQKTSSLGTISLDMYFLSQFIKVNP